MNIYCVNEPFWLDPLKKFLMFRSRKILNDHTGMESFPVGYVRKSTGLLQRINRSILPDCELCLPLCNTDKLESLLLIMVDIWPQSFSLQAISGMKSGFPLRVVCNSAHQEDLGSLYIHSEDCNNITYFLLSGEIYVFTCMSNA